MVIFYSKLKNKLRGHHLTLILYGDQSNMAAGVMWPEADFDFIRECCLCWNNQ